MIERINNSYQKYLIIYRSNLSRLNNHFIILNISMFFLSGLVSRGCTFTFYSISCFLFPAILTILPIAPAGRLWFYLLNLFLEWVGIYFFVASIAYWVQSGARFGGRHAHPVFHPPPATVLLLPLFGVFTNGM